MKIDSTIAAVVTGGASGLGRASVEALRAAGAKVAIFDMNPATGEAAAAATGATFCQVDVTSDDSLAAGFAKAAAANGPARILIACAGGGNGLTTIKLDKATGAIRRFPTAEFARILTLNTVGTFATITHFAAAAAELDLVDGERGAIVCTASVAAQDGQAGQAAYSAAKAGIIGMTLPVARDLSRFGIRINTILPGIFDTPAMEQTPPAMKESLGAMVAFPKRLGNSAEYAQLALEMCRNGYFNAESVRLDGGIRFAAR